MMIFQKIWVFLLQAFLYVLDKLAAPKYSL
jgi:hypothetical protein